ncbi:MAG: 3-beta hydroxysteroid dehydrogenase [Gammaproteobacteria bacterium]|nr:3-beta hydroxysteroid dehydrogenase [Gammaproteobacteria bacterium]|tara:strand:- start:39214 stop:39969 length:756 start_codon:yes stop_codon:yes gene_type:complete
MTERLKDKVALITGAAQGLGKEMAKSMMEEGAKVYISDINQDMLDETVSELSCSGIKLDVTKSEDWEKAVTQIKEQSGSLNILVNNAGIGNGGDIESTDIETWKLVHNVNLDSVFLGCKLALPLMRDSGNGSIINISSMSGIVASHNTSAYNSSKAAVRHLSKSIALHCAKSTNLVRCNSIHPVFTRTAMVQSMIDAAPDRNIEQKLIQQIPIRKLAEPIDIANAAIFLASDESSFITGTELLIDGGLSAT